MNIEEKARRLVDGLHAVMEEAERADKNSPARGEKLSPQEMRVLCKLDREKCCIMSGIAGAIRLSLSSVTALVDRLVERKLVRRDRSNEDRRIVEVELTEEGRELSQAALEGRVGFARDMLKALSAEEQDKLLSLFGKITDRIKAEGKAG